MSEALAASLLSEFGALVARIRDTPICGPVLSQRVLLALERVLVCGLRDVAIFGRTTLWDYLAHLPDVLPKAHALTLLYVPFGSGSGVAQARHWLRHALATHRLSESLEALQWGPHPVKYFAPWAVLRAPKLLPRFLEHLQTLSSRHVLYSLPPLTDLGVLALEAWCGPPAAEALDLPLTPVQLSLLAELKAAHTIPDFAAHFTPVLFNDLLLSLPPPRIQISQWLDGDPEEIVLDALLEGRASGLIDRIYSEADGLYPYTALIRRERDAIIAAINTALMLPRDQAEYEREEADRRRREAEQRARDEAEKRLREKKKKAKAVVEAAIEAPVEASTENENSEVKPPSEQEIKVAPTVTSERSESPYFEPPSFLYADNEEKQPQSTSPIPTLRSSGSLRSSHRQWSLLSTSAQSPLMAQSATPTSPSEFPSSSFTPNSDAYSATSSPARSYSAEFNVPSTSAGTRLSNEPSPPSVSSSVPEIAISDTPHTASVSVGSLNSNEDGNDHRDVQHGCVERGDEDGEYIEHYEEDEEGSDAYEDLSEAEDLSDSISSAGSLMDSSSAALSSTPGQIPTPSRLVPLVKSTPEYRSSGLSPSVSAFLDSALLNSPHRNFSPSTYVATPTAPPSPFLVASNNAKNAVSLAPLAPASRSTTLAQLLEAYGNDSEKEASEYESDSDSYAPSLQDLGTPSGLASLVRLDYEPPPFIHVPDDLPAPQVRVRSPSAAAPVPEVDLISSPAVSPLSSDNGTGLSLSMPSVPPPSRVCCTCNAPLSSTPQRCAYAGTVHCSSCMSAHKLPIPAAVVARWSFTKHSVSQESYSLMRSLWSVPSINLQLHPNVYALHPPLRTLRLLREQLSTLAPFIQACRTALSLLDDWQNRLHLIFSIHLYSMQDLVDLREGKLLKLLLNAARRCLAHVSSSCESCKGKGHYCALCTKADILFTFSVGVTACKACSALYHTQCADIVHLNDTRNVTAKDGNIRCPKCKRRAELAAKH